SLSDSCSEPVFDVYWLDHRTKRGLGSKGNRRSRIRIRGRYTLFVVCCFAVRTGYPEYEAAKLHQKSVVLQYGDRVIPYTKPGATPPLRSKVVRAPDTKNTNRRLHQSSVVLL